MPISPLTRCPMVIVCTTHSLIVLCAGEVKFYSPFLFFASPIVTLRTWRNDRLALVWIVCICIIVHAWGNDRSCMRCIWLYVFSRFFRFTSDSLYAFMYDAWNVLCIYIACGFCMFILLIMHLPCVIFGQLFAISLVNLDFFTFVSYYLIARMSFHFFFLQFVFVISYVFMHLSHSCCYWDSVQRNNFIFVVTFSALF